MIRRKFGFIGFIGFVGLITNKGQRITGNEQGFYGISGVDYCPGGVLGGKGCVIQQAYDLEVGAGTFNPATLSRAFPFTS